MAEHEAVRTIRIRGIPDGLDAMASKLKAVEGAYAGVARQSETVAVATERVEKRQLSAKAAYDRIQRSLDDQFRLEEKIWRVQRDLQRASDQGLVSEQRRMQLLDLATQRYGASSAAVTGYSNAIGKGAAAANENFAKSAGLARYEMINLGRQVGDIGTMLAMGQSPFAILASQGAQVADIFATTSASIGSVIRQIGGGALRFATSGAGLATGAGAIIAAGAYSALSYADAQKQVENALRGVGAASGVSLAGINRFAEAEARAGKVSTASAREIAAAFASAGRVDPTKLPGLGSFTKEYSVFTGMGIDDAMKELAGAFADPSKGAETLAGKIGGLNSAALRWIEAQQAAGNMLGAQNSLLQVFQQQVEGATERTGLFARAWDRVKRSVSDADDALGRALNGPTDAERLASLQQQRDRLQQSPGLGVANQLRMLEAQIRPLEAIVELERQRAAIDQRTAKAGNSSLAASAIADHIDPFRKQVEELLSLETKLQEAMRLNPRGAGYEEWAKALDKVQGARATLLPSMDRERQSHELTMRAITARTLAERTVIEVAREGLRLSGEKISAAEREIAMQRKAAEVAAQATRDAQDALRASRDQLAIAGKSPGEAFRIQQEQARRDNVERFGGINTGMPATTAAANGLDAAFAESLRKLQAAVPGLTVTSGFRSYDQQAKLYAEKPNLAAPPGRSQHEKGLAADLAYNGSGQLPAWVRERAAEFGISFPLANRARNPEPWHAEPIGGRNRAGATGSGSAADEIFRNAFSARDLNAIESVIGGANREIERQTQLLALQRNGWSQSAEELAKASKAQELVNALQRDGVAIGPGLQGQIDQTAAAYGELVRQQEQLRATQEAMRSIGDIGKDALKGFISDLRSGKTAAEAFQNTLNRVADKLIDMAINDLFGKAFGGTGGGFGNIVSSLFGFGGGGGGYNFGGTSGGSFSFGAGGYSGAGPYFADGGYTGHGGKYDPAGVVHRGEFVFDAAATSRIGVRALEGLRRGLPGYANGSYVGPQPFIPPAANGNAPSAQPIVNNVQVVAPPGAKVRQEQRQNETGGKDLLVFIDEAVADRLATPGTNSSRALRTGYGVRPAVTRR